MRALISICEGILGDIESDIEDYVEILDRMKKDFAWVQRLRMDDAVYYEAALFNVTQDGFRQASRSNAEFKRNIANFMVATCCPYVCVNVDDDIDNWDEREYGKREFMPNDADTDILNAGPDDYRWSWHGSGSFYHFFWDADYVHSLDQEELLTNKKCQDFSKKLLKVAKKYGLNLKPIF